jgi:thiol-disulfide isomerase/thioredoxin
VTARACGVALVLALSLGCGPGGSAIANSEPAVPFELERLGGGSVRLDNYRGKLLLLDFWATWCPPCVLEVPELNAFYAEHRERGVDVLAIAVDGDAAALESFAREHGVAYPIAIGSAELALRYGGQAFPFHVLVAPDGRVLERLEPGFHSRDELDELIARHLAPEE